MLGFRLNEEQESFRLAVRSFAEKALAPRVEELERTETFPMDLFRELGRLGYLGVGYPEEYGGSGGDMVMRCLLIEEIARVNCGFAAALLAHVGLGCIPIFRFGTEEQKRSYLVPAIRGEKLGAFGLSEPNSGSDAASIRTRAERRGDVYVINGTKMFITNGNIADYCLVAAYTDPAKRGSGISMFIVDTRTPGFSVSRKLKKTGHHTSETAALAFDDMRVPAAALLGGIEGGFKQVTGTLEGGRITHAARSVGVSQAALEAALKYAREREQFGQPIAQARAYGDGGRDGAHLDVARGLALRSGILHARGGDGQTVRLRGRPAGHLGGGADLRRLRLHHRVPGRALLARRAPHDHHRGDDGDPADDHRARAGAVAI